MVESALSAKGAIGDAHHSSDRLTGAYVGRGTERRNVSTDEGHADLAAALQRVVDEHGATRWTPPERDRPVVRRAPRVAAVEND